MIRIRRISLIPTKLFPAEPYLLQAHATPRVGNSQLPTPMSGRAHEYDPGDEDRPSGSVESLVRKSRVSVPRDVPRLPLVPRDVGAQ